MAGRFQELFRLAPNQYYKGSPVVIEAGAIQKDTVDGRILAQIKIRNLSEKTVNACKVSIRAFEPNGVEITGIPAYSYLDLSAVSGSDFGSKVPVYLPDNKTRKICVAVIEVVFTDGSLWKGDSKDWEPLPVQTTVTNQLADPELSHQYTIETGYDCSFVPMIQDGLFFCTCGTINLGETSSCRKCGRTYSSLQGKIDPSYLKLRLEERQERERKEKEQEEQRLTELKTQKEKRNKRIFKTIAVTLSVIVIIAVIAVVGKQIIIPAAQDFIAQRTATKLMESGSFDEAQSAFTALGDYRDAENMALESMYRKADSFLQAGDNTNAILLWESLGEYSDSKKRAEDAIEKISNDANAMGYLEASRLMESGKYQEAEEAFAVLDEYKDAPSKAEECSEKQKEADYQSALADMKSGNYQQATVKFRNLTDYKDSKDLYVSSAYECACDMMDKEDYNNAFYFFGYASGYKDADDQKLEAAYQNASHLLESGDYLAALTILRVECKGYKNSDELLRDAEYAYASNHMDHSDKQTYTYLKELSDVGYPGAAALYSQLFDWRVDVYGISNVENSGRRIMKEISRYDTVYFSYEEWRTAGEGL